MSLSRLRAESEKLAETSGRSAFLQRGFKQRFQNAQNAPEAESAPAAGKAVADQAGVANGLGAGGAFGITVQDTETDEMKVVESVRNVGNKTLFFRENMWMDEESAEKLIRNKSIIVEIKRFSKEYFDLVAENTKEENKVLSQQRADETLMVWLRGKNYLIK